MVLRGWTWSFLTLALATACTSVDAEGEATTQEGGDTTTTAGGAALGGFCVEACEQASDCKSISSPSTAVCGDGRCYGEFSCFEHFECPAGLTCIDQAAQLGIELPFELTSCAQPCTDSSDCGLGDDPLSTAESYRCEDSFCRYVGCTSDEACRTSSLKAEGFDWECRGSNTGSSRGCVAPCEVDADCEGFSDDPVERCDTDFGYCRSFECTTDADCGGFVETCSTSSAVVSSASAVVERKGG